MEAHFNLKIILLGATNIGKTCILNRYKDGYYTPSFSWTNGVEYYSLKVIEMKDGKKVRLFIMDTQGYYVIHRPSLFFGYYKTVHGIIFVYDVTNKNSFKDLIGLINYLKKEISMELPIYLVGNKIDCKEKREVLKEEGEELAKCHGFMFNECSAKTGENVDFLFNKLVNNIYDTNTEIIELKEKKKKEEEKNKKKEEKKKKEEEKQKKEEECMRKNTIILKKYISF